MNPVKIVLHLSVAFNKKGKDLALQKRDGETTEYLNKIFLEQNNNTLKFGHLITMQTFLMTK